MVRKLNAINLIKKAVIFVMFLLFVALTAVSALAEVESTADNTAFYEGYELIAEKGELKLFSDMQSGEFILVNNSGDEWRSTPADILEDPYSKGAAKAVLRSLVSVTYVNKVESFSTKKEYKANSYNAVINGNVTTEKIENGLKVIFTFEEAGVTVPFEYSLADGFLSASVDLKGITEGDEFKITEISLLPGFCQGSWKEDGYIFVPDGSGALINYNNGCETEYKEMVYGDELAIEKELNSTVKETVRLPVFGTVSGNSALMGIITEGDGAAVINAASSNSSNGYNYVGASYVMRSLTSKAMLTKSYAKQYAYRMNNVNTKLDRFTVRYYPLTGENAGYSGFAKTYRNYLINEKGLTKKVTTPTFNFSLIGAVDVKANFLGFTYYKPKALTTYEQAVNIMKSLSDMDISSVSIRYEGWQNNGLVNRTVPSSVKTMKILGGKKDFSSLLTYTKENNIALYTDVDFVNFNGGKNKYAAKTVFNEVAKQYSYMYSVYAPRLDTKFNKLLSAGKLSKTAEKYLKSYEKLNNSHISIASLTNTIYSDLGDKNFYYRADVPLLVEEIMRKYSDKGIKIAGDSANAYAAVYTDKIFSTPAGCSGFLMENEQVPFYQMVFHGYVSMTMPSQERADNPLDNYLAAVETGSELLWTGIAEDAAILSDTTSDKYYSTTYTLWQSDAANKYKEYMPLLQKIADKEIVSHRSVAKNVTETVFAGGITVTVNHSDSPYITDTVEIAPKSFALS